MRPHPAITVLPDRTWFPNLAKRRKKLEMENPLRAALGMLVLGMVCATVHAQQDPASARDTDSEASYLAHIAAANSALRLHKLRKQNAG